jgi:hypothetical protein
MKDEKNNLVIRAKYSEEDNSEVLINLSWLSFGGQEPEADEKAKILKAVKKLINQELELYIQRTFCSTYAQVGFRLDE